MRLIVSGLTLTTFEYCKCCNQALSETYLRLSPPPRLGEPLDILKGDLRLTAGAAIASAADVAS